MEGYTFDRFLGGSKIVEYVTDKRLSAKSYIRYMLIRLQKMFKYINMPDTIPPSIFEYMLMTNGHCFVTKVEDKLYAFVGGFGGEPDVYYRPTIYTVANPALRYSGMHGIETDAPGKSKQDYKIGEEGILVRNDSLWVGLMPLMSRYATLMAENIVTIRSADVMLRVVALLTAPDDKTKIAAETYLRKLEKGEFGVIGENRFFDGVKMQSPPSNNGSYLTQFIELQQYLKGSFYNEIGLNANFNMKREAIGSGESSLNEDSLLPLAENMLQCRKEDIAAINELFGTNISVEFDSAWSMNIKEMETELEQKSSDVELQEAEVEKFEAEADSISRLTEVQVEEHDDMKTTTGNIAFSTGGLNSSIRDEQEEVKENEEHSEESNSDE